MQSGDSSRPSHSIPELLAPAGSMETFWAGFKAGADAFYLGASRFNARKRAKNFSDEELHEIIRFSHHHRKRVYVTINSLIFDREIPDLINLLNLLDEAQADAVIIQDLGVLYLLKRYFPNLPVHASTQLFCHNSQQAGYLREQGVKRIVFPRELTIDEMQAIARRVPLEYEAFVHGAMCFAFSGCCLFSSHLFGASGNRGECRQPCRFAIKNQHAPEYPFSMKDLSLAQVLPELLNKVPLASLKIEGRLKNAAYVSETVAAYRAILDAVSSGKPVSKSETTFTGQRQTAQGYLRGARYESLVSIRSPGTIGEIVGRVVKTGRNEIGIAATDRLSRGDRLNLQTQEGKRVFEGTLLDFRREGSIVWWEIQDENQTLGKMKDLVVVRTGTSAPENPRRLISKEASLFKTIALSVELTYSQSERFLQVTGKCAGDILSLTRSYPLDLEGNPALAWKISSVKTLFTETGATMLKVEDVRITFPENQYCTFGTLKRIRRDFFGRFSEHANLYRTARKASRKAKILEELDRLLNHNRSQSERSFSYLPDSAKADLLVADVTLADPIPVPASPRTILLPPLFVPEASVEAWEQRTASLVSQGYHQFMAPTYGWIALFRKAGVRIFAGPYLYIVNSFALQALREQDLVGFTVSPDIPTDDIQNLLSSPEFLRPLNPRCEMLVSRLKIPDREYHVKDRSLRPVDHGDYTVLTDA